LKSELIDCVPLTAGHSTLGYKFSIEGFIPKVYSLPIDDKRKLRLSASVLFIKPVYVSEGKHRLKIDSKSECGATSTTYEFLPISFMPSLKSTGLIKLLVKYSPK
jgi:hypothetical protein